MKLALTLLVGGWLAAASGAACAQAAAASAPATAASKTVPARNPVLTAAENAKEPGVQRPDERVIPQISVPLRSRQSTILAAAAASVPAGRASGVVNDAAARCLASSGSEKAACERDAAASRPAQPKR
ncbi:hypothetical protein [Roseateles asaccharophilus]|uniref:Uncharacterized protein n=1 Tax=Roseateles asaccharophilus TaxID=582607 RepID=A0ABU2A7Z5_9BURK|nr:hypothetical protein [Roseateles asaccharophilus]MDR7333311.1 hypothetical protein [Roseateles asaccharophilus]